MSTAKRILAEAMIQAANRVNHYQTAVMERVRPVFYGAYGKDHVFDIQSDDFRFSMSFQNIELGSTIVQRIEARREPETVAVIKTIVEKGDRVLELGGAYGYFTSIMALCTGETGKVLSVEGIPENYRILKANIERNNLHWVQVHNVFLTAEGEGTLEFDATTETFEEAFANRGKANGASKGKISVPSVKLSKLLAENDFAPNRIFMDIEGFEVPVFEDLVASGVLAKHRPTILFETHETLYEPGRGLDYIKDMLRKSGYYFRGLSGNLMCHPEKPRA
jgi:FkbM family methyltransferase